MNAWPGWLLLALVLLVGGSVGVLLGLVLTRGLNLVTVSYTPVRNDADCTMDPV